MRDYASMTKEELIEEVKFLDIAYDHAVEDRRRVIQMVEDVADDRDKDYEYSYAPGVARSILAKLGIRPWL